MPKLALIYVRGMLRALTAVKKTLECLNLEKKQSCIIVEDTPSMRGMIKKIEHYITWGEIDDTTIKALVTKKGEQKTYHLNPPKGGYERKGIKMPYTKGGVLGYRGKEINTLLKRMIT